MKKHKWEPIINFPSHLDPLKRVYRDHLHCLLKLAVMRRGRGGAGGQQLAAEANQEVEEGKWKRKVVKQGEKEKRAITWCVSIEPHRREWEMIKRGREERGKDTGERRGIQQGKRSTGTGVRELGVGYKIMGLFILMTKYSRKCGVYVHNTFRHVRMKNAHEL